MGTLAEDLERVRQLYRSIKTPWKRPRFPDPPAEFLPPEKFLELAKEAVLVHHTKINHPFCVKLFRGEWTVKELHGWIKQEYHAVMQTLRNDANIVANGGTLEEIRDQLTVLIEEAGEDLCGGKYPAHPELFVRMGEGLGLKREEIINSEPSALMQLIIDEERYRGLRLTIGGLPSNLRLGERINALVFPIWAEVLRDKYQVSDKALDFFYAHAVDEEHGKVGERVVLSRAVTKEAQTEIWMRLRRGQAKQWINYDAYHEAAEVAGEEVLG
jgi:pyrroloquinoline quinone (PQQ) biosynthesis protein C